MRFSAFQIPVEGFPEMIPDFLYQAFRFQHLHFFSIRKDFLHKIVGGMQEKLKEDAFGGFLGFFLRLVQRKAADVFALVAAAFKDDFLRVLLRQVHHAECIFEMFAEIVFVFFPELGFGNVQVIDPVEAEGFQHLVFGVHGNQVPAVFGFLQCQRVDLSGSHQLVFVIVMFKGHHSFIPDGKEKVVEAFHAGRFPAFEKDKIGKIGMDVQGIAHLERFQQLLVVLVHFHDRAALDIIPVITFLFVVDRQVEEIRNFPDVPLQRTHGVAFYLRILKFERVQQVFLQLRVGSRGTFQSFDNQSVPSEVKVFFHSDPFIVQPGCVLLCRMEHGHFMAEF